MNVSSRKWGFIVSDNFRVLDSAPFEGSQPSPEFLVLPGDGLVSVRQGLHPGKLLLIRFRIISGSRGFPVQPHELGLPVQQARDLLRRLGDMGVVIDGLSRVGDGLPATIPDDLPIFPDKRREDQLPGRRHLLLRGEMEELHDFLKREVEVRNALSPGGVIGDLLMISQHNLADPGDRDPEFIRELAGRLAFRPPPGNLFVPDNEFSAAGTGHSVSSLYKVPVRSISRTEKTS